MSTAKWFILITAIFVVVFLILTGGSNPFSFGDAYFKPRASVNPFPSKDPSVSETESVNDLGNDVTAGEGIIIDR